MPRRVEFLNPSDPRFGAGDDLDDEALEAERDADDDEAYEAHRADVLEERIENRRER